MVILLHGTAVDPVASRCHSQVQCSGSSKWHLSAGAWGMTALRGGVSEGQRSRHFPKHHHKGAFASHNRCVPPSIHCLLLQGASTTTTMAAGTSAIAALATVEQSQLIEQQELAQQEHALVAEEQVEEFDRKAVARSVSMFVHPPGMELASKHAT